MPDRASRQPEKGRQGLLRSFAHAYEGLVAAVRTQRNMRIHLLVALGVLLIAALLRLDAIELAIVVLTIVVVLATEMLNTALEFTVDLVTPEYHPLAKLAKDVSAAAVFASSIGAVAVGVLLVADDLAALISGGLLPSSPLAWAGALAAVGVSFLASVALAAIAGPREGPHAAGLRGFAPSASAAVACAAWAGATLVAAGGSPGDWPLVCALAGVPALLLCAGRIESGARSAREVTSGAVLGTAVAVTTLAVL